MFSLFQKKPSGTTITLKLSGLHCSSCSLNIDSELEDLPGVISTRTSYAKQETVITYDPMLAQPSQFKSIIKGLGYKIVG
jgi:copper chaperone CopZ